MSSNSSQSNDVSQSSTSDASDQSNTSGPFEDRDEVTTLNKIISHTDANTETKYPVPLVSCKVQQLCENRVFLDNSQTVYSSKSVYDILTSSTPNREHRRFISEPKGIPLVNAVSGNEVVVAVVVAVVDAMETIAETRNMTGIHCWDVNEENILLRGIKPTKNNQQPPRRGYFVDYNNVILPTDSSKDEVREQTASLPFLCIRDLEGQTRPYHMLDCWQSILFLLCWLGTYGLRDCRLHESLKHGLPIFKWVWAKDLSQRNITRNGFIEDSLRTMAQRRREHMADLKGFTGKILNNFNNSLPGFGTLRDFTKELFCRLNRYRDLFEGESGTTNDSSGRSPDEISNDLVRWAKDYQKSLLEQPGWVEPIQDVVGTTSRKRLPLPNRRSDRLAGKRTKHYNEQL